MYCAGPLCSRPVLAIVPLHCVGAGAPYVRRSLCADFHWAHSATVCPLCAEPHYDECPLSGAKQTFPHVRYSPQSGYGSSGFRCPLCAKSGHQLSALGRPLMRHPLSEVCPALTASTTMRMAWMTTGALSIM